MQKLPHRTDSTSTRYVGGLSRSFPGCRSDSKGGYVVNLDKPMLENAPTYDMNEDFRWTPDYGRHVNKYYNAQNYW